MKDFLQYSMFDTENVFNPERFKETVLDDRFQDCLRIGVTQGLIKTKNKFNYGSNSMSVMSHCLHEDVYNAIKNELSAQMAADSFTFTSSISGNERLFFEYQGYVFIVKLADSTQNNTKQESKIRNQELGRHVISIVYTLDTFRENINTLSLQYIKGQTIVWQHTIPVQNIPIFEDIDNNEVEIVAQKPKLKRASLNKKAI